MGRSLFGTYMKNLSLKDNRKLTWNDSEFQGKKEEPVVEEAISTPSPTPKKEKFLITEEMIDKWGANYQEEEYAQFERKYNKLVQNYGEKTSFHIEGLVVYIRYRVKEEMATAKGLVKEAKEWGQLAAKAAQDAKINVSQLSKSDISGGVDVLSQLSEAVETEIGIIPNLPRLTAQPYDDADVIIWAVISYYRRLEDKPPVEYSDIWHFYDEMLEEHFIAKGYSEDEVAVFKEKRNNIFRDLGDVYVEPLYDTGEDDE
ncbi:hypothetical protein ACU3L3_06870 [Priestia endophytica]